MNLVRSMGMTLPAFPSVPLLLGFACCTVTSGCEVGPPAAQDRARTDSRTLVLRWQRLVDDRGQTCDRCGNTEQAVAQAHASLTQMLAPVGLHVELRKETLSAAEFAANPGESNRIWIDGRPMEDLIGATVGQSPCCKACGDRECRTITVEGKVHESIPPELIVRAGMIAAAAHVGPVPGAATASGPSGQAGSCCAGTGTGTGCCTATGTSCGTAATRPDR